MARVVFTQNIQRHVECPETEARGGSVREVLDNVFAANPRRDPTCSTPGRLAAAHDGLR
jgi:hypothetical protein